MSLWKNIDDPTGNGKPLFANTSNLTSNSTTHGTTANNIGVYGNVYGVSAGEIAATANPHSGAHAGWVSQKIGTGPVKTISIFNGGGGYNTANFLVFTDSSWSKSGTGLNVSYGIANSQNLLQPFSPTPAWNTIATLTINNYGSGFTNVLALTVTAQGTNSSPALFNVALGGRAGRTAYETLIAMGSISGDDPKDNIFFTGV